MKHIISLKILSRYSEGYHRQSDWTILFLFWGLLQKGWIWIAGCPVFYERHEKKVYMICIKTSKSLSWHESLVPILLMLLLQETLTKDLIWFNTWWNWNTSFDKNKTLKTEKFCNRTTHLDFFSCVEALEPNLHLTTL